jgi:hypothetical protein
MQNGLSSGILSGRARYSRFRQFAVDVTQTPGEVPPPK